ncbi:hypothetical protein AYI69_g4107 [Smittium culicis]|uniref:Uncharacterized protein n=1 Tax=Smittium culicis TaxID=133412 RepID=A0A1R1YGG0_9FUNG|nr:hypothetical protein AYI69_g4107 [Smittium culicis]
MKASQSTLNSFFRDTKNIEARKNIQNFQEAKLSEISSTNKTKLHEPDSNKRKIDQALGDFANNDFRQVSHKALSPRIIKAEISKSSSSPLTTKLHEFFSPKCSTARNIIEPPFQANSQDIIHNSTLNKIDSNFDPNILPTNSSSPDNTLNIEYIEIGNNTAPSKSSSVHDSALYPTNHISHCNSNTDSHSHILQAIQDTNFSSLYL